MTVDRQLFFVVVFSSLEKFVRSVNASVVHIHQDTDGRFSVNQFFGIKDPQNMDSGYTTSYRK